MLMETIRAHHVEFLKLYPNCWRPKLHYMSHVPGCWWRSGVLLSCFAPERKHREVKQTLKFAYNKSALTAIAYELYRFSRVLKNPQTFEPIHLNGKVNKGAMVIYAVDGNNLTIDEFGVAIATESGSFRKGDLLHWARNGERRCGFATGFVRLRVAEFVRYAAIVHPCAQTVDAGVWFKQPVQVAVIQADQILCALRYLVRGDKFLPQFPVDN